jgi:hypothetical protein
MAQVPLNRLASFFLIARFSWGYTRITLPARILMNSQVRARRSAATNFRERSFDTGRALISVASSKAVR